MDIRRMLGHARHPFRSLRGLWRRGSAPFRLIARYEHQTLRILDRVLERDSSSVDVGAHSGAVLRHIVARAPAGQHFAFEPLPGYAERLKAEFPSVHVYGAALSDREGTSTFQHVRNKPGWSGFRPIGYGQPEEIEEVTVETMRLDDVLPQNAPIQLVKVDVEGAEMAVFRGAQRTLSRWRPYVIFEHEVWAADYYGTTPQEVYNFLTQTCQLSVSRLRDWLKGRAPLTREQFVRRYRTGKDFYFLAHP